VRRRLVARVELGEDPLPAEVAELHLHERGSRLADVARSAVVGVGHRADPALPAAIRAVRRLMSPITRPASSTASKTRS